MKTQATVLAACLLFLSNSSIFAQNCSLNAGVDQIVCNGQPLTLTATTAGSLNATPNYQWSLVSGSPITITNPGSLATTLTAVNPGSYIIQFSGVCADGVTAYDSISVQVLPVPAQPIAGPDQQICTPQLVNLAANSPPAGQTGVWVIPATTTGITIAALASATTTATATTAGVKPLIWQISNAACAVSDTMNIRVVSPAAISAGSNFTAGCNGSCITLNGSDPGLSPQSGLWQLVSGPSTPTFSNANLKNTTVCDLVTGTYIFKWTVSGPCSNGSAQVTITVSNTFTSPNVGPAVSYTLFCNSSGVTSLVLKALTLAPGETGAWSFISGPATPTIAAPTKSNTIVSGFSGAGAYVFNFTVANAHCSNTVVQTVYFQESLTGLTTPADQQLACGVTTTTTAITFSGITNTNGLTRLGTLVSGPITAGVTAVRGGSTPTDTWTMAGMTAAGKYLFRFEYRDACSTLFRDMLIYVSNAPSGATAGSNQLLPCSATSTALAGSNPVTGSGTWSQVYGPNQGIFSSTSAVQPTITGLIAGTYDFRWTVSGGGACAPTEADVIVVKASSTVVTANAGTNATLCPGSFKLSGNAAGPTQTGTWTVAPSAGINFSNVNDPGSTASGLAPSAAYTFTWTIKNACASSSNAVIITTNANTTIPLPNAGPDVCLPSGTTTLNLTGNTAAGISSFWTAINGGTIASASSAITTATVSSDNTYRFVYSLTAPGCTILYDTVVYTVAATVSTAAAGADQNICAAILPQSATLSATNPTTGTGAWSQTGGDGAAIIVSPGSNTTAINNLSAGQFEFQYLISNGVCSSSTDRVVVNITLQPTTANAGPDISQCNVLATTLITMAANVPTSGTGAWTIVSGPFGTAPTFSAAASPSSNITGLSNGVYVLRWTISTGPGCAESTDDMTLTVSRSADASGTGNAFCDVTSISLAGNPGTTGTWTYTTKPAAAAIPTITAITGENALADGISTGTYVFNYSLPAVGACPASNSSRTVNVYTAATSIANAGADINLCAGVTTATLTGNIPASGTAAWTQISGPNTPTPANINAQAYDTSFSNLVEGLYFYRYSINTNAACTASADTVMIIKERTANAQPDQRLCNVTTALLAGNAPVYSTGSWSQISGPTTATFQVPNSAATQVTGLGVGTYVFCWTIAAVGACPASSSNVQVTVDAPVTATSAGADATVCPGSSSPTLGTTATGGVTYSWSPASYLSDATIAQPTFTGTPYPGTYTYTLNSTNGSCTATAQVSVTVRAYPAAFSVANGAVTTFTAVNAGVGASYLWNFGSGSSPATAATIGPFNVTYSGAGTKTASLTVTDGNGCTSTESLSFPATAVTLPLQLLSFTAQATGDNVILNWEITDAVNVKSFAIERSADGINYAMVGSVSFSSYTSDYDFTDVHVPASYKTYYYRLTTIDNDGNDDYSPILAISLAGTSLQLSVSPNPFTNLLTLRIYLKSNESSLSMKLLTIQGAVIAEQEFSGLAEGFQSMLIYVPSNISAGVYILRVKPENSIPYYIKLLK